MRFASDPGRFAAFSQASAACVCRFVAKTCIDAPTEALLLALARECGLEAHRDAMRAGEADQHHRAACGDALAVAKSGPSPRRQLRKALLKA
jgi:glucose-6-phosphate isomerase